MYLLSKRIFFPPLSLEILLNKIGRDVISEIVLRISEVLFYSYNSCLFLCVAAMVVDDDDGYFWCLGMEWDFLSFFPILCVSLCIKTLCIWLNGNVYACTLKSSLKFSFCLIRI